MALLFSLFISLDSSFDILQSVLVVKSIMWDLLLALFSFL